mmetsp:Transcript_25859/g.54935  ORF Transcript_25859/g.54935 Transcript_25859/m.54935 type:complete len:176 (-) Transcript_25859:327-854(-)
MPTLMTVVTMLGTFSEKAESELRLVQNMNNPMGVVAQAASMQLQRRYDTTLNEDSRAMLDNQAKSAGRLGMELLKSQQRRVLLQALGHLRGLHLTTSIFVLHAAVISIYASASCSIALESLVALQPKVFTVLHQKHEADHPPKPLIGVIVSAKFNPEQHSSIAGADRQCHAGSHE